MTNQHPITPSPELVREWCAHSNKHETYDQFWCHIATQAARWGADQELEACCGFIGCEHSVAWSNKLRIARRSKPPSLKEQALSALENLNGECLLEGFECPEKVATIRRALEALPND